VVRLIRHVRFSVSPFLDHDSGGRNAYASKPAGEGLALYLELAVDLVGSVDPRTGLLMNVSDIDRVVRRFAVPVFTRQIRAHWGRGEHIPLSRVARMLSCAYEQLRDKFPAARVDRLTLKLNPFRTLGMDTKEPGKMYFSETFEFAATHKLWHDGFSAPENRALFGKCANPTGHGHNYLVEVTIVTPPDAPPLGIGQFEHIVDTRLMQVLDHKNLNLDVPAFREKTPTVENLAVFAWERLAGGFDPALLHCVTVWESDRTCCSYYGPAAS
jgi:6-pyruvoyltetrahydropterin/6-carboxytetrahydropterin synthase